MRAEAVLLWLALTSGCSAPTVAAPSDPPHPDVGSKPSQGQEAPSSTPESAPASAASEATAKGPTDAEVPADLAVHVERDSAGMHVRVGRRGFLVALRRDDARAVNDVTARLDVPPEGTDVTPIAWETTKLATLETTRGTIGVDARGNLRVRVGESPPSVAEDVKRGHRCRAHGDGSGGFTVVCRTGTILAVRNLASDTPQEGVTTVTHDGTFVRLDLAAQAGRAAAFVIAYTDRNTRVVVRAEASLVAGEEKPSFALVSAYRDQPIAVLMPVMPSPHLRHMRPDFDDVSF
jgi:hypothetical protein